MKAVVTKASAIAGAFTCLLTLAAASRAQAETKTFGKVADGPNSITVKASRSLIVSRGVKTWKRDLEIVVYRSLDTDNFYSDQHYSDLDTKNLHNALFALATRYQQWKGKHLGTQQLEIEVRKANDSTGVQGIVVDLQMDEMGKIAIVLTQGPVAVETPVANLPKLRAIVDSAIAWLSAAPGSGVVRKTTK